MPQVIIERQNRAGISFEYLPRSIVIATTPKPVYW